MAAPKDKRNEALRQRTRARRRALQALYQWQMAGQDLSAIEAQFNDEMDMGQVDVELFKQLLHGVPTQLNLIDEQLSPFLDRPINELDPIERAVLRMGTYELNERLEVPLRVVINEAVELAKQFGAEQSHRYVNGVLDKVARQNPFRAAELKK
ncbi:N utilization substance protein B [Alkalilimnicola ehrlichii]|uniref:Transcription antitermination protein NusB n=1 Tax=Alkalilimnicola ehrlichii TaxID=351052 RepID=A0A3E0WQ67_9GAMM|nr:transcription antitermination factor NusB [Alkalilimnicola ehrlichii]RFA27016.1 N utilization substance protein B [Alkalilimnicola ehrlichii]RFA34136.1 N utilization substance protein B [Alkalilimnicola ehrlichii]